MPKITKMKMPVDKEPEISLGTQMESEVGWGCVLGDHRLSLFITYLLPGIYRFLKDFLKRFYLLF